MSELTPGPWYANTTLARDFPKVFAGHALIAEVVNVDDAGPIAAVPDMLAALKLVSEYFAERVARSDAEPAVRAALAKAGHAA